MSKIKNALWGELLQRQADGDEPGLNAPCPNCLEREVVEDDVCRECWNEINGQFGVGA